MHRDVAVPVFNFKLGVQCLAIKQHQPSTSSCANYNERPITCNIDSTCRILQPTGKQLLSTSHVASGAHTGWQCSVCEGFRHVVQDAKSLAQTQQ